MDNLSWMIVVDEYEYKRYEDRIRARVIADGKVRSYCKSLADAIQYLRDHTDLSSVDCTFNYFMKSRTHSYSDAVAV